ncbi:13200_t:CDS:2, partial [Gigaspora margarita]
MVSTSASNLRTRVWHYFDPPIEESGKVKAKCRLCPVDTYLTITNSGTTSLRNHPLKIPRSNEHILRNALVKWIATDTLPFTTVESESFRELVEIIRKLEGDITVPSAKSVKRDLINKYSVLKGITAHWIDENWEIRSQVLDLAPFDGSHTGANIA